jgi:hypothetical protein
MATKSNGFQTIAYSLLFFAVVSVFLFLLGERRVGVYVSLFSIGFLASTFVFNPRGKKWLAADLVAVACIVAVICIEVLNYFASVAGA